MGHEELPCKNRLPMYQKVGVHSTSLKREPTSPIKWGQEVSRWGGAVRNATETSPWEPKRFPPPSKGESSEAHPLWCLRWMQDELREIQTAA
jgi:hypothetical protein